MRNRDALATLRAAAQELASRLLATPGEPVTIHIEPRNAEYVRTVVRRKVEPRGYRLTVQCTAAHRDRFDMRQFGKPGPFRFQLAAAT